MPRRGSGYTATTVSKEVLDQAQATIEKINQEAKYKKIRSMTQFVEEAIMFFAIHGDERISSEVTLENIVKLTLERDELLKAVCRHFLELPAEEAKAKLKILLTKKEKVSFRKLLEEA